jgi:FkbM family methyltransferase
VLDTVKRLIRESPFGSLAMKIRGTPHAGQVPRPSARTNSLNDQYDQQTFEVMRRVLRSDSCCIDVGAHTGSILEEMIRLAPGGAHFAFEPIPPLAAKLCSDFPTVRVVEAAVSDRSGTADFVYVENDPGYSGLRQRMYDRPDPVLKSITVNVVQLDDAIPKDQPVALIKLDIEGGEIHALRGALQLVLRCRPVIVFEGSSRSTGQYGVTPKEIFSLIDEQFGYRLSTMQRWLSNKPPYVEAEFCHNWDNGPDFYFIAYPA